MSKNHPMKKFLTLLLALGFPCLFYAQSVFPESKDSVLWNIGFWRFYENIYDTTIFPSGDTTFCDNKWIKITFTNSSVPRAYYRIEGKKVYFRMNANCALADHLIYDFDLKVGDTLYVTTNLAETQGYTGSRGVSVHIDSVSTIVVNGLPRKRMAVTYRYRDSKAIRFGLIQDRYDIWTEGMGSRIFPFYAMWCVSHGNCEDSNLFVRCFQTSKQIFYQDARSPFCSPRLGTATREPIQRLPIRLYPNPLSSGEALQIELSSLSDQVATYQVFDLLGRVKARGALGYWQGDHLSISLDPLPSGFYQLQLLDRAGRQLALEKMVVR